MSAADIREPQTVGLRERHPVQGTRSERSMSSTSTTLDTPESDDPEKESQTIGTTPDGTVFVVPKTHDMVSQLFDIRQTKNLSDLAVIFVLGLLIFATYVLPRSLKQPVLGATFIFWRVAYNVGIGYLLRVQSNHKRLVAWAKRSHIFDNPNTGKNPRPQLYKLIKSELEAKIPEGYTFEDAPIEYNTWLVFRRLVDLILMCDFMSYCLYAFVSGGAPVGEWWLSTAIRWVLGIALIIANIWIKLDAHRVVKDYAWYWGDFFFQIDKKLVFDGVFEMAPHPMYSIGYIGYYGISLMAASYSVLIVSLCAHAFQFIFLVVVENPHIKKIYNQPAPRNRPEPPTSDSDRPISDIEQKKGRPLVFFKPLAVHNLLGLWNYDLFRVADVQVLLLQGAVILVAAITSSSPFCQWMFIWHAIAWRLWYTGYLGYRLNRQSQEKQWTRHFVKFGDSTDQAWRDWMGQHHLGMTMCNVSFIAAAWKMYTFPEDWMYGLALLKHVVGVCLIALQIWTAASVYEELGDFGWFYGDFFFDHAPKLTYNGIYRFLNNPQRILGLVGFWGAALITSSPSILSLAMLGQVLTHGFMEMVEKPHMQKLYGRQIRTEAGLTKTIRRSIPPPLKKWGGSFDKVLNESTQFVVDFLETAHPKLAAGVSTIVRDTTALFSQYPARITLTRLAPDLAGFDPRDYSINIEGTSSFPTTADERSTGREGKSARSPLERTDEFKPLTYEYGTPIKVTWTAPPNHSKADWIGLYKVADNASRDVTRVASAGRWVATVPNEYEDSPGDTGILAFDQKVPADNNTRDCVQGEMVFEGDKLWWTQGVFEFRYHHDGKHNVMATSLPFEIGIPRFDEANDFGSNDLVRSAIEEALLPVVRNCFDRKDEMAPNTVDDDFGNLNEQDSKYPKRVVFAIHQMFGIEFTPVVVLSDYSVKKLAWRIHTAKELLAPYSMSHSKGTSTPNNEKA